MSHTRDKWFLDLNGPRYAINTIGYPEKLGSKHIAMVNVSDKLTPEESLANARLIVVAPDLYSELQKARDNLAIIVSEELVLEYYDFVSMDGALEKAKGIQARLSEEVDDV